MAKILVLKPVNLDSSVIKTLEKRKLIRVLKPCASILSVKPGSGRMKTFYSSKPESGTHKVACIGLNSGKIRLNYHTDNEEFVFIKNTAYKCKDIFMIIGYHKRKILEIKAIKGNLSADDFILIRWRYNDPSGCIFTMLKGTAHCEYVAPGKGNPPYFFVIEPSRLKMNFLKMKGYRITVKGEE